MIIGFLESVFIPTLPPNQDSQEQDSQEIETEISGPDRFSRVTGSSPSIAVINLILPQLTC